MNNEIKTIIKIINTIYKDIGDKKTNKEVIELLIEELLELIKAVEKLETELIKAVVKLERWGVIND